MYTKNHKKKNELWAKRKGNEKVGANRKISSTNNVAAFVMLVSGVNNFEIIISGNAGEWLKSGV